MEIKDGAIIPGIGIGDIRLDITKEQLLPLIGSDYRERIREIDSVVEIENARFWIAADGKVDQIGVSKNFNGKYKNIIGLGSTLNDIQKYVGSYVQVHDTYEMVNEKGICFELEDIEEWDELKAPIEFIYVFRER